MKLTSKEAVEYVEKNLKEFGGEMTQSQIAKEIELTPGRVCQIAKSIRSEIINAIVTVEQEMVEPVVVAIP